MQSTKVVVVHNVIFFNTDTKSPKYNHAFLRAFHNIHVVGEASLPEEFGKAVLDIKRTLDCCKVTVEIKSAVPCRVTHYKNRYGHVVLEFSGKTAMTVALKYPNEVLAELVKSKVQEQLT